jgi:hypothetical protein
MRKHTLSALFIILLGFETGFAQRSRFEIEFAGGSFRYDVIYPGGVAFKGNARYNATKWLSIVGGYQLANYSNFPENIKWDFVEDNGYLQRNGLSQSMDQLIRERLVRGGIFYLPEWNLSRYHSFTLGPTLKLFANYKLNLGLFYHLQYMHTASLTMAVNKATYATLNPRTPEDVISYSIITVPSSRWGFGPVWGAEITGKINEAFSIVANASRYDVFMLQNPNITVLSFRHNHASITMGLRYRL